MTLVRYVCSAEINSFEFRAVLNHVLSKEEVEWYRCRLAFRVVWVDARR